MRLVLEGDPNTCIPTKGYNLRLIDGTTPHHAICWMSSNIPTKEEFTQILKELHHRSRWTTRDWDRNLSLDGGRLKCFFRSEIKVPEIWRKELGACSKCGADFMRWLIREFLRAGPAGRVIIPKSQIWVDSDSSEDDEGVNHQTDFWRAIKRNPDQLEHDNNEKHLKNSSDLPQHIKLTPEEVQQFLDYKKFLMENKEQMEKSAAAMKIDAEIKSVAKEAPLATDHNSSILSTARKE